MGRWRASYLISTLTKFTNLSNPNPSFHRHLSTLLVVSAPNPFHRFFKFRTFSALSAQSSFYGSDFDYRVDNYDENYELQIKEDDEVGKIPIRAYFLSTSIDLKSMHAENSRNVVTPTSRSSNYIALRFGNFPPENTGLSILERVSCWRYMVIFQYGSAVLFNIEDHEVEPYLEIVRRHASGLLPETRKDDYAVKEKPLLVEDMQGGPDYIVLKDLDIDSIRIIGSVLGQSVALDHFVSQVDGMVEEFAGINRAMEKTGDFTMHRKKLFQLVGKANSNLADVILKVGLFDRSEIAWRDAKYAQIYEYLREEYEIAQRFGNLNFKLKFVEHNIHFLQEVLQNRRSDLLEWCIIFLLTIENVIGIYEIIRDSNLISL